MFSSLNDIEKVTRDDFTGCKTLSKAEPMSLDVEKQKAKND